MHKRWTDKLHIWGHIRQQLVAFQDLRLVFANINAAAGTATLEANSMGAARRETDKYYLDPRT